MIVSEIIKNALNETQAAFDQHNQLVNDKYEELNRAYETGGEEGLARAMGISLEQLDHAINEMGFEYGAHADDDRGELIAQVMDDFADQHLFHGDWSE